MSGKKIYLLDANAFIEAKNAFYSFSICPGYWKSLIEHGKVENVGSIDKIRNEILSNKHGDELKEFIKKKLPRIFFDKTDIPTVANRFSEIINWVDGKKQYEKQAKAKFAIGADGWLIAFASLDTDNRIVVTQEVSAEDSKTKIKIPDVCKPFGVNSINLFKMLSDLTISFDYSGA
ncbi:MAG: DUF4411 family protein [Bacteroidota bacterium]